MSTPTIWHDVECLPGSLVLEDIPDFHGLIPGAWCQQGLTGTEAQTADWALVACQHLVGKEGLHANDINVPYSVPWGVFFMYVQVIQWISLLLSCNICIANF